MFISPQDQALEQKPPVPPRPQNQKAATMQTEPSEEHVQTLVEFLGMDRDLARRWLRVKQNDVNAVSSAYLDNEDLAKAEASETWSEDVWKGDRDGNNIHSLAATAPPSRVPSRAGDRLQPISQAQEDEDLAAALANSQQDISVMQYQQQEGGVVRSDGTETKFGPATKDSYDAYSWAMVSTSQTTSEIVPDIPLEKRQHRLPEPRALKQVPGADYLSSLLMICHSIPAIREAMLMRDSVRNDYGEDGEWWKGHAIQAGQIVQTQDGSIADPDKKFDDIIAEVQRIMAFLELSHRTYAQPGALANSEAIRDNTVSRRSRPIIEQFLETWMAAAGSRDGPDGGREWHNLFNTEILECGANEGRESSFTLIDISVTAADGEQAELGDMLDGLLWVTGPADVTDRDTFIKEAAAVLVMQLQQSDAAAGQLRATVPPQLYIDKYLQANAGATQEIRRQRANGKSKLSKIDQAINRLSTWRKPFSNETMSAKLLLGTTRDFYVKEDHDSQANSDMVNGDPTGNALSDMARKLDQLMENVDKKLAELNALREETRRAILGAAKDVTPGLEEEHRYTLVGVSTKPNVTYVLRHKDEDDEEEVDQEDEGTPEGAEWWRIEYKVNATGSGATLDRSKISGYDVLRAVELEYNSALLVYAGDAALTYSSADDGLPEPLVKFIQRDNQLFAEELQNARQASATAPPAYELPADEVARESLERGERKSLDSTRAEGGGSQDSLFGDEQGPSAYDVSRMTMDMDEDPPAHDILLEDLHAPAPPQAGSEMQERPHAPLHPGLRRRGSWETSSATRDSRRDDHDGWME